MFLGLGPKVISLLVVVLMFGCGLGAVVPGWRNGVSGATIPPTFGTDWTVSGVTRYDGGNSVLTGNLTVQSGGNLVLNNLTVAIASAFDGQFHVDIKAGGVFRLFNSTLKANAASRMQWFHSNGTLEILNSTVRDFGLDKKFDGVNLTGGSAILKNDTFANNNLGLRIANIHPTIEKCSISSGWESGLVINSTSMTAKGMTITGNSDSTGVGGAVLVGTGSRLILRNSSVMNNNVNGIVIQDGGTVEAYNTTNTGNPFDYYIGYSALDTNLSYYNSKFSKGKIFGPPLTKPVVHLKTYWYVNITAKWETDDSPASGANYKIFNKTKFKSFEGVLDDKGEHRFVPVQESELTNINNVSFNPYTFNVTASKGPGVRFTTYNSTLDMSKNLEFILDDKPPKLEISAPLNASATNSTQIELK